MKCENCYENDSEGFYLDDMVVCQSCYENAIKHADLVREHHIQEALTGDL